MNVHQPIQPTAWVRNNYIEPLDYYQEIANNYQLIFDPVEARRFLIKIKGKENVALDFETTGLYPRDAEVRLSCFYHPDFGSVIIDHFFAGSFGDLVDFMLHNEWLVYNAKFEVRWFDYFRYGKVRLLDVDFMAKAKLGGHPSSLARMVRRDLKVDLDKTLQTSDWSQHRLSDAQYAYGGLDAVLTYAEYAYWDEELNDDQFASIDVFNDAVRGTVECEETGLILDTEIHSANIERWEMKQENALRCLRRMVPKSVLNNLNSNKQVSDFLKTQLDKKSILAWPVTGKRGDLSLDRKIIAPIAAKAPYPFSRWLNAFILYRYYAKYLSTYGDKLLTKQRMAGAVTSRFNIAQAATGRYSSSSDNLQNIPRKVYVRRAFCAPHGRGRKMVLADYKGIEIRVLAELSGDPQLLQDQIYGDVHAGSASTIFHINEDAFNAVLHDETDPHYYAYKEMRSKAKGFTFQLTYGAAAPALSIVLKTSVDKAAEAIELWAQRYPKAYGYRSTVFDAMHNTGFIPVCDGRTIYVRKPDRTLPVAANYGIQGAAASVMYRAVFHVHRLKVEAGLHQQVRLAATVHDELLLYADDDAAPAAKDILKEGMRLGWLDIFPGSNTDNLVDAVIGMNWGDKP